MKNKYQIYRITVKKNPKTLKTQVNPQTHDPLTPQTFQFSL